MKEQENDMKKEVDFCVKGILEFRAKLREVLEAKTSKVTATSHYLPPKYRFEIMKSLQNHVRRIAIDDDVITLSFPD